MRKNLSRNIYLSGGSTMMPGIAERLTDELQYILPATCAVKVHASPFRQHAALQGASVLASLPNFASISVWNEDWHEVGPEVLKRWQEDTLAPTSAFSDDDDEDFVPSKPRPKGATGSMFVPHAQGAVDGDEDEENDDEDEDDEDDSAAAAAWAQPAPAFGGSTADDIFHEPDEMEEYI